jgi:hypothetical protein
MSIPLRERYIKSVIYLAMYGPVTFMLPIVATGDGRARFVLATQRLTRARDSSDSGIWV